MFFHALSEQLALRVDPLAALELADDDLCVGLAFSGLCYGHAEERWPLVERVLRSKLEQVSEPTSPWLWTSPCRMLRGCGRASEAAEVLRQTGKHELALPLYEALLAAGKGLRGELSYLAPEVRAPAEEILAKLWEPLPGEVAVSEKPAAATGEQVEPSAKAAPKKRRAPPKGSRTRR